ncbi:MAG: hypothetical protein PF542_02120 [Nanoarchaeota archaeon]|jgi:hypothetical protein|nr:hypothetical protein [Nanoarchaeota archaeon]
MFGKEKNKKNKDNKAGAVRSFKKKDPEIKIKVAEVKRKFSSPEEVTAYYRAEGERVKQALKDFKLKQTEIQLQLSREEYLKISSQKKDLDELREDLLKHQKEIEAKITELRGVKEKEALHQKSVNAFTKKMVLLEVESKKILETREALINHQNDLIFKMKELAKLSNTKFKATDLPTSEDLFKFEASKGEVIAKSKDLLSEEMKILFSDKNILRGIDEKTIQKLRELNLKIIETQNLKKDILKKLELLDISEEKAARELERAEVGVKKLEVLYKKLLKK